MPRHMIAARICLMLLIGLAQEAVGQESTAHLRGTKLLTIDMPLDEVMVAGISGFALRALQQSQLQREV